MTDSIMSKAATMEIPINSNGDTGTLPEDDSLEQAANLQWSLDEQVGSSRGTRDLQQVMVSGPNLNETSIVSGGYGGTAEGIISTSSIKGPAVHYNAEFNKRISVEGIDLRMKAGRVSVPPSSSLRCHIASHSNEYQGSNMHHSSSSSSMTAEEASRGVAVEKIETVKKWGLNTYKCTKQMISERFGRGSRTVDLELEAQIEVLRDTKKKYENVLRLARALTNHFYNMVQTQHALGDTFADLSQKSPELRDEFGYNAETQKLLCKNGETLLGAVNFFVSSINTLVNKTMEDSLMTIKMYEGARLEFDAYRSDLEELSLGPKDAVAMARIDAAQQQYQVQKDKYERLRSDVIIKLKFLEENKVKVMHKQLLLFHNAISAYFAGNQQQLEQTLKQFNIKLRPPGADKPSWLEEHILSLYLHDSNPKCRCRYVSMHRCSLGLLLLFLSKLLSLSFTGCSGSFRPPVIFPWASRHRCSMKKLNWDTIPSQRVLGKLNVWTSMRPQRVLELDIQSIEELFSHVDKRASLRNSKVMGLNTPVAEMVQDISQANWLRFGSGKLQELCKLLPEEREVKQLLSFRGNLSVLPDADRFMVQLVKVPGYEERLKTMALREEFFPLMEEVKISVAVMTKAANELLDCDDLHSVIRLGGYSANAIGFRMTSLLNLADTKANKPGMNLMHYVAKQAEDIDAELLTFHTSWSTLGWEQGIIHTQVCKEEVIMDFERQLKKRAEAKLADVEFSVLELKALSNAVAEYFCEDPATFKLEECCSIFHSFCKRFDTAVKENQEREAADQRRKRKESMRFVAKRRSIVSCPGPDSDRDSGIESALHSFLPPLQRE
ncbi:Arfaptin-2 [Dissostichus eleginoides]|uniref:Arfaptin-2 n=1 Tax=Dissostichus eleginoides TaxID=100907 RepID=A0AAD9BFV8_DISEL|nr:Arfaptin-2 [Dissostichus eleginoides]